MRTCRCLIEEIVADKPTNQLASGATMRRAAPRIGRNDPCPCGSGKKHKHYCHDKDRERLRHSSEVADLTKEEVEADPERHLTPERIEKMMPRDLLRLDPKKIPP